MDKIQLLRQRRSKVLAAGKEIRKTIAALTDAESFVELSGFSFSKNDFYDGFSGETVSKDGVLRRGGRRGRRRDGVCHDRRLSRVYRRAKF